MPVRLPFCGHRWRFRQERSYSPSKYGSQQIWGVKGRWIWLQSSSSNRRHCGGCFPSLCLCFFVPKTKGLPQISSFEMSVFQVSLPQVLLSFPSSYATSGGSLNLPTSYRNAYIDKGNLLALPQNSFSKSLISPT